MSTSDDRPTHVRWVVGTLLAAAAAIAYLDRVIISNVVKELQDEVGITPYQAGWVLASFVIGYGLMQVPMGRLGDLRGARFLLPAIVVLWSAMTGLTTFAATFGLLCAVRFAFGLVQAGVFPLTVPVMRRWFPVEKRGTAQGLVISSTRVGAILAMLAAPVIAWLGWKTTFMVCGGVGIVWSVVFAWYFRDRPADHPGTNDSEVKLIGSSQSTGLSEGPGLSARVLATNANMWGMSLGQFFGAMGYYLYITWFPTYLREEYNFDLTTAGLLTVLPHLGGWVGSGLGGWLVDRLYAVTGSLRWSRRGVWLCGKTLCGVLFLVASQVANPYVAVGIIAVAAMCSDAGSPASWAMVTDVGRRHAGVVFGVQNTAGSIGAIICPLLVPAVVGWWGWHAVLPVFACIFFASAASWLWVDASRPIGEE